MTHFKLLTLLWVVFNASLISAQTFPCDEKIYISQNTGNPPTRLITVEQEMGAISFDEIVSYDALHVNGLGYNIQDGYLYGTDSDGKIYRLAIDGSYNDLGYFTSLNNLGVVCGDINYRGEYVILNRHNGQIALFALGNRAELLFETSLYWDPSSPGRGGGTTSNFSDVVIHPNRPNTLVAIQHAWATPSAMQGYVVFIDADPVSPTFGMIRPQFQVDISILHAVGGFFVNQYAEIMAYGKNTGIQGRHNSLYKFDLQNESVEFLGLGPIARGVDGCSCPLPVVLTKKVDSLKVGCDSTQVFYHLQLTSESIYTYQDFSIHDVLQPGGKIDQLLQTPNVANANVNASRNLLEYDVRNLSQGDSLQFRFSVRVSNANFPYSNQAAITSLWQEGDAIILSDDPETSASFDPTLIDTTGLKIIEPFEAPEEHLTICDGDTVIWRNQEIYSTGMYQAKTDQGCDTIFTLRVGVAENYQVDLYETICPGDSIQFFGQWIASSGYYSETLQSIQGCDSTINLDVAVSDTLKETLRAIRCPSQTIEIKDLSIDSFGVFETFTPSTSGSCDTLWVITVNPPPEVEVTATTINSCPGENNGSIAILHNQNLIDTFYWSTGESTSSIDDLMTGAYVLSYQDTFGCWNEEQFDVETLELPAFQIEVDQADCHNDFAGAISINPEASQSRFLLDGEDFNPQNDFKTGQKSVHLTHRYAHCKEDTIIQVPQIDTLPLDVLLDASGECGGQADMKLNWPGSSDAIHSFTITGVDSFTFDIDEWTYHFEANSSTTIRAFIVDSHGCEYVRSVQLEVVDDDRMYIPNVFTPNGDNVNDVLHIYGSPCIKRIEKFLIYDRWGELVFEAYDFLPGEKGWDGLLNDSHMSAGVYTYYAVGVSHSGNRIQRRGSATLLK